MYSYARQERRKQVDNRLLLGAAASSRAMIAWTASAPPKKKIGAQQLKKTVVTPPPPQVPRRVVVVASSVPAAATATATKLRQKLLPDNVLCGSSPIIQRLRRGNTEGDKACAVLLSSPGRVASLLPRVCKFARPVLTRDAFVRAFYYSVLPALLASKQPSWLLLRIRSGHPPVWEQESMPMDRINPDTRVRVPTPEARKKLLEAISVTNGENASSYALRIVIERPGTAHALIALISKECAVILDPNGTLNHAVLCFGSAENFLMMLKRELSLVQCSLVVAPPIPPLFCYAKSKCSRSYVSGGACTLASGAVALWAAFRSLSPLSALRSLTSLSNRERKCLVTEAADALMVLTLACVLARSEGDGVVEEERREVMRVVEKMLITKN